jgi:hypothetical protein
MQQYKNYASKKPKQTKQEVRPRQDAPLQKSATDTSTWEGRTYTARTVKSGKPVTRNLIMWRTDVKL